MGRPPISQDILDKALHVYLSGIGVVDAAKQFGISPFPLTKEIKKRQLKRSGCRSYRVSQKQSQRKQSLVENVDKAIAMYGKGVFSLAEVCRVTQTNQQAVTRQMKKLGLQIRPNSGGNWRKKSRISDDIQDKMAEAYLKGFGSVEAARMYGHHKNTCLEILKRRGIPVRDRWGMPSSPLSRQDAITNKIKDFTHNEKVRFYMSHDYKNWRKTVFVLCKFECKRCGDKRGGNLEVHHIFPKGKYPHMMLLVENGILLCKTCHKKITGHEEQEADGLLSKIGSTTYPLVLYSEMPVLLK